MISFQGAKAFMTATWRNRGKAPPPTVFLLGPPGIGKSAIPAEVVQSMGPDALFEVLDLTSRSPEDIGGLPFREGGQTCYSPQAWAKRMSAPDAVGVVVFDDLPAASAATAAAVRQVVLDHRINGTTLAPGILVVVTGNRREDLSGASLLPAHFRNAVCTLEIEAQFEPWCSWFIAHGGDPAIAGFLRWKPSLFSTLPKDADAQGRFATPRSWTMLSSCLPAAEEARCIPDIVAGFVGEGAALEFVAFQSTIASLPPIADVFKNPEGVLPNPQESLDTPDRIIAVTTGLGYHAAALVKEALAVPGAPSASRNPRVLATLDKLFVALSWVVKDQVEHVASAVMAFTSGGGTRDALAAYGLSNPSATRAVLDHIRTALK